METRQVYHSVIDKVYHWRNLEAASRAVRKNRGAGGIDGVSVKAWAGREEENLRRLSRLLRADRYRGKPVRRTYIPKPGSRKKRPLGIPIIADRVVQQAVLNVLGPAFEPHFHDSSHGFRKGRSTHTAAKQVEEYRRAGYQVVVDLDISGFYDHVDHEILMSLVRKVVKDRRVLGLIRGWLRAGVMEEGKVKYLTSGTPQGGVISPLLSNVYLTPLDHALEDAGHKHVRYADDVLILCRSQAEAVRALETAKAALARLRLEVNEDKTSIRTFREGVEYLGFRFHRAGRGIGGKSLRGLYSKVREVTKRQQGSRPVAAVIEDLNPVLRGWGNYHRAGRNVGMFTRLDKWVRNRLRSYLTGRWRTRHGPEGGKPSAEEFARQGLVSLRRLLRPKVVQCRLC